MLNNTVIEENSTSRFQVQIFETSLAFVLAVMSLATIGGGLLNLRNGDTGGAVMCFLVVVVLMGVFAVFVSVRRITIDRDADLVYLTSRALLRNRQQSFKLSDAKTFTFTRQTDGVETRAERGEYQLSRWGYSIRMTTSDGTEYDLYTMKGTHVYEMGHKMRDWLDAHHPLADGPNP